MIRSLHLAPIEEEGSRGERIRNQIIGTNATAKWVAFVDDDDTLSPDYIEHWNWPVSMIPLM
jgi:hypothetical protein